MPHGPARHRSDISDLGEIGALVYELYGLTEEEIAIVDARGQTRRGGSETRPYQGCVATEASPLRHTAHTTEMLRFAQHDRSALPAEPVHAATCVAMSGGRSWYTCRE